MTRPKILVKVVAYAGRDTLASLILMRNWLSISGGSVHLSGISARIERGVEMTGRGTNPLLIATIATQLMTRRTPICSQNVVRAAGLNRGSVAFFVNKEGLI